MKATCISPDVESRMRFKQMATLVPAITSLQLTGSLREVHEKMIAGQSYGAVFISNRFDEITTKEFISSGKKTAGGTDSAYMMVLNANIANATELAKFSLFGIDSFLFEPFSADGISECITLATKINKRRADARMQAGLSVLISGIIKNVDDLWAQFQSGEVSQAPKRSLEHISGIIKGLSPELQQYYFDELAEKTGSLPAPPRIQRKPVYTGASARIKKKSI